MLYIVGTGHHYQFGAGTQFGRDRCSESEERAFTEMLRNLSRATAAEVFAEELNAQALAEVGKKSSVIQTLAHELAATHLFCEPDRTERITLGIRDENEIRVSRFPKELSDETVQILATESWRRRELEWLRRLRPLKTKNIIFVCGANHIATFVPLAKEDGHECTVVHQDWEA